MQEVNVTDIKVKSGVTQSGPKAGDKWELIIIVGDDGSEFTTFDKKAKEVGIGGVIELEPVLKGGKVNFTKFTIKEKGQVAAPQAEQAVNNGGDSPEKRQSIENQTRAYIIADLFKADLATPELVVKLQDWLLKLGEDTPAPKAESKSEPAGKPAPDKTTQAAIESGEFENVGQLLMACSKQFGMNRSTTLAELNVEDPKEITDLTKAWQQICAVHEKPEQA